MNLETALYVTQNDRVLANGVSSTMRTAADRAVGRKRLDTLRQQGAKPNQTISRIATATHMMLAVP